MDVAMVTVWRALLVSTLRTLRMRVERIDGTTMHHWL